MMCGPGIGAIIQSVSELATASYANQCSAPLLWCAHVYGHGHAYRHMRWACATFCRKSSRRGLVIVSTGTFYTRAMDMPSAMLVPPSNPCLSAPCSLSCAGIAHQDDRLGPELSNGTWHMPNACLCARLYTCLCTCLHTHLWCAGRVGALGTVIVSDIPAMLLSRRRRRHVHCAGMGVPVLKK